MDGKAATGGQLAASTEQRPFAAKRHGGIETQINVPPASTGRLWKAIAFALRCPACDALDHKAETGRRRSREGLTEQYRRCEVCGIRFRVVWE